MTPEELEKLPKKLEKIFGKLEQDVMADIVERLKETKEGNPSTDWLILRMVAMGKSKAAIKKAIQKALNLAEKEIDAIYQTAEASILTRSVEVYQSVGKDSIPFAENGGLQQLVEAIKRQTKEEMVNITKTAGFMTKNEKSEPVVTPAARFLQEKLDQAMMEIDTGVYDYNTSIQKVIDEMTASGLRTVEYASGHTDRVEVAARRAVMTGNAQLTDQINEKNAETLETDYWEVDWHMGARNTGTGYRNHQSWQGKVYSSEEMKTVCGLGQMLGFAGINCYHIRYPFIPGVSKRKYTDEWLEEQNRKENTKKRYRGKEYDTYSALQHQRKIERTIRKQNQDIKLLEQAEADPEVITAAKSRRKLLDKEYVDFSNQMGLRQQRERLATPKNSQKVSIPLIDDKTAKKRFAKLGAGMSEDGTPGKPEKIGEIDVRNTDAAMDYYGERIRYDEVENAIVVDKNGTVYYSVGDKDTVSLEGIPLEAASITHNHPSSNGIVSFGRDDFRLLQTNQGIRKLIAVNEEYTYSVSVLKDISKLSYHDYYRKAMEQANIMDPEFEMQDMVFQILDKEGYLKYERKRVESNPNS